LTEGDGPYRTDIGAFSAEETFRINVVGVEGGADLGSGTALGKIEDLVDLYFVAGPDTATAEDALVQVPGDHGIGRFLFVFRKLNTEAGRFQLEPVNKILQITIAVLFAGQTIMIAGGPEQLHDQTLGIANFLGIRSDNHAGADGHATGGDEGASALDIHHADATGTDFGCARVMTKGRDKNTVFPGDFQDHLTRRRLNFPAVNCYGDLFFHVTLLNVT
jgi:hypothetical protein